MGDKRERLQGEIAALQEQQAEINQQVEDKLAELTEFEIKDPGIVYFSVSFLENILQAKALTDVFTLQTSNEMPMLIEIDIQPESDKLTTNPGSINYIIAPRVKEDANFDPNADFDMNDIDDGDDEDAMTVEELEENLQDAG